MEGKENHRVEGKEKVHITTHKDRLTAKFCDHIKTEGRYLDRGGPAPGLYLIVGPGGTAKSWLLRYRFQSQRPEMGLGPYPEVSLAAARDKAIDARRLLADDTDPLAQRKELRHQQWLADAKSLTFKQVADKLFIDKTKGPRPWWGHHSLKTQTNRLQILHPVHDLQLNSGEAAEALTLKLFNLLEPKWLKTPAWAHAIKYLAHMVCDHAYALKVLPANIANPAGGPLDLLLQVRQPAGGHWEGIHYTQAPELYRRLEEQSQPAYNTFTITEAERATGVPFYVINLAIQEGKLRATKVPNPDNNTMMKEEWRIEPTDLFARYPKVVDVIPGVRSVTVFLVRFIVLNANRQDEVRKMRWPEYHEEEGAWVIPWQRLKEGDEIHQNLVIPLNHRSIAILQQMKAQQQRDGIYTDDGYVFGVYPSRYNGSNTTLGKPPHGNTTLLRAFRRALPEKDQKACLHAMRTAFRSWGEDQCHPDGTPRFAEKDLERALGHASGFGETDVSRGYSRQAKRIRALIPIFDGWGDYLAGNVIPFRKQHAAGRGE